MSKFRYLLFCFAVTVATWAAGQDMLTERVYWIDNDIGTLKTLDPSVATVDVSGLARGVHTFTMQVKDDQGRWSVPVTKYFVISQVNQQEAKTITEREYWIDNDLSTRAALGESVATVDISSLAVGVHSLTMRVKDDVGQWSAAVTKYFIKANNSEDEVNTIVRCLYWFDDNIGDPQVVDVDGATGTVSVDVAGLTAGKHNLSWRVCDAKGAWSDTFVSEDFMRYTVPASGIGTFSASTAMALPDGLTAHYTSTTKTSGSKLYVNVGNISGTTIPAETGVLLMGDGGVTFTLVRSVGDVTPPEDNTLMPVVQATHVAQTSGEYTNFMLKDGQFVRIAVDPESVKMPENRAYLPVLSSVLGEGASSKSILLMWDNSEPTGIDAIQQREEDGRRYNLNGQRVGRDYKGIVIMNGKKVLKK